MQYDYIIVGAGSAGCILANRLSESGKYTVLILEAGGSDDSFWYKIPVGFAKSYYNRDCNWMFYSEPEKELGDRSVYCPRGKIQGGSGTINAMIYIRGLKNDFNDWEAAGNPGWGFKDVLPYFKKLESHPAGNSEYHNANGPIRITPMKAEAHPICNYYLAACKEIGLPLSDDFNGPNPEGAGIYDINVRNGKRDSSSFAYLHPALNRPNLKLIHYAFAEKIVLDAHKKAVGIIYTHDGKQVEVRAQREIILAAGAIHTPKRIHSIWYGKSTKFTFK